MEDKRVEDGTDSRFHLKLLALLPVLALCAMGVLALLYSFPDGNKLEIGIILAGLIALCKDVYNYNFGSSRRGNSSRT